MQLFSAVFQTYDNGRVTLQLFSAGGEEGPYTDPPAAPGREITACTDNRHSYPAGK